MSESPISREDEAWAVSYAENYWKHGEEVKTQRAFDILLRLHCQLIEHGIKRNQEVKELQEAMKKQ